MNILSIVFKDNIATYTVHLNSIMEGVNLET